MRVLSFVLLALTCCFSSEINAHGFALDTLVSTVDRHVAIQDVVIKNSLASVDTKTNRVSFNAIANTISTRSNAYCVITIGTTKLITHPLQLFWSVTRNDWVAARDLNTADILLTLTDSVCIDEIAELQSAIPITFFTFTVSDTPTFCVTEHDIVVHNVIAEMAILSEGAALLVGLPCVCTAPVAVPIVSVLTLAGSLGIFAWRFFKDRRARQQREQEFLLKEQYECAREMGQQGLVEMLPVLLVEQQQNNQEKAVKKELPKEPSGGNDCNNPDDPEDQEKNKLLPVKPKSTKKVHSAQESNLVSATINGVTKIGTAQEIAEWIRKQKSIILDLLQPIFNNLIKNSHQIKSQSVHMNHISHIFSPKHLKDGLMCINDNVYNVCLQIVKIIEKADKAHMFAQESNTIRTVVNNIPLEIRLYMENGLLRSIDAFAGYSDRTLGKLIEITA